MGLWSTVWCIYYIYIHKDHESLWIQCLKSLSFFNSGGASQCSKNIMFLYLNALHQLSSLWILTWRPWTQLFLLTFKGVKDKSIKKYSAGRQWHRALLFSGFNLKVNTWMDIYIYIYIYIHIIHHHTSIWVNYTVIIHQPESCGH